MKFFLKTWFVLTAMLLLASQLFYSQPALAELVAIPDLSARVTDLTQTLSPAVKSLLEEKLNTFEKQKGSQIAVLIVPTTRPEEIEQYSIRVVEKWKLGRKKVDDGILVLVAKDDHKMRIEVGYGLEGAIPDLTAKRVISEVIAPKFKQGNFADGLVDGVDKLIGLVDGEALPAPDESQIGFTSLQPIHLIPIGGLIFMVVAYVGGIVRFIFGRTFGSLITGITIGGVIWYLTAVLIWSLASGFFAILLGFLLGSVKYKNGSFVDGNGRGTFSSGGFGGGGGFSGGGGGFGGGGASGSW